jgi:membrane protease YdiL (CAAX protease family)
MKKIKDKLSEKELLKVFTKLFLVLLYIMVGALGFPTNGNFEEFNNIVLGYYVVGFIFIFIITFFSFESLKNFFNDFFSHFKKNVWYIFKYFFLTIILFGISRIAIMSILPVTPSSNDFIRETAAHYPIYVFFVIVLYVPFVEGVIFRKYLHDIIKNKYLFLFFSSIFYGYLHIAGEYASIPEFFALFIPIWIIGLGWSYSYSKSGNIFVSILCHFAYNLFVFLTMII